MSTYPTSDRRIVVTPSDSSFLSCDDIDDAIRSLALAYNIQKEKISRVFEEQWPDFLPSDVENEMFQDERLAWCMAQYMRCNDVEGCNLPLTYYHRGIFNGDKNWFQRGLLNSEEGATAFLEHLRPNLPSGCDFEGIKSFALSNILDRTNGECGWGGGPYAFDRLDDAKGAQKSGLDYSTPEFFMGSIWKLTSRDQCSASALIELCREQFLPVIVKFTANNSKIRAYVNNLWHYLHRKKFNIDLEPNRYTFTGGGVTVPRSQILELVVEFN
jgi:hypothetical protein